MSALVIGGPAWKVGFWPIASIRGNATLHRSWSEADIDCRRGAGLLHCEAAKLQRYYANAPPSMAAVGMRSKYR
jgi:hypothetical protein